MIRAKYIMCKKTAVTRDTPGREVVFKLMATGCPGIPVVNGQMEVVGIVSMCDMLGAAKEKGSEINNITAEQVMSKNPITAEPDASLDDLARIMAENKYSIIPIVKNKRLVGIVSGREIMDTYVEPHLYTIFEEQ
jgi:CBS domain-containing protein